MLLGATAIAAVVGIITGGLAARFAPADKVSWAGFAFVPIWFLIELIFEASVEALGSHPRTARILIAAALIGGFYGTWFVMRL